jgi:hypothetical protein
LDTQEKFTTALRERAGERGLELIVERTYANCGFYSLQPPGSFRPVLRFPFSFRIGYSSFDGGVGEPGPLGLREDGTPWSGVRGGEHDEVLDRVVELLDAGEPRCGRVVELAGVSL